MPEDTTDSRPARRYRFGVFEADTATGELRRQGLRVKINAQPFQLLCMLLDRPGELVTRDEISNVLWPDGMFVDFDHGVNSAVNRIREALGDSAGSPRFVETLARRGYRFVAPVEFITDQIFGHTASGETSPSDAQIPNHEPVDLSTPVPDPPPEPRTRILSSPRDLPAVPHRRVRGLFILFQLMYLGFYIGALANLAEIEDLVSPLPRATVVYGVLLVSAAILIPVRAFMLTAVIFRAPAFRQKFLKLWPFLLLFDELWSLSPFLLLHHINFGLALACTTLLVYSPFAQRSLVLMDAGCESAAPTR